MFVTLRFRPSCDDDGQPVAILAEYKCPLHECREWHCLATFDIQLYAMPACNKLFEKFAIGVLEAMAQREREKVEKNRLASEPGMN